MPHDGVMDNNSALNRTVPDRLSRPRPGRMLAGVAAAMADRTGIDVGFVRLALVVSLFFGGLGLVAYAAGWALLPNEGEATAPAERWLARS